MGAAILETSTDFSTGPAGASVDIGAAAGEEELAGSIGTPRLSSRPLGRLATRTEGAVVHTCA